MHLRTQSSISKSIALAASLAIAGGSAVGTAVQAQDEAPPVQEDAAPVVVDPGYAPAVRYPDNGAFFQDHASTAAEGALRGAGAYVRALGAANLDHSLAAMNYQEATRRSLENTLKYAETYYARRDLRYDQEEKHGRKPLTMEGYRKLAEAAGADRLTPEQFDPETGEVLWPELLQARVLEPYRQRIDQVLAARSNTVNDTGLGSQTYEQVRQMTEAMQNVLDRNRKSLPSHLYVNAVRFLESVRFESRFPPPTNVAVAEE